MLFTDEKLLLVAKVGVNPSSENGQSNMIATYEINFTELKSELTGQFTMGEFASTSRTKSNVIFHLDENNSQSVAYNPQSHVEPSKELYKNML